MLGWHISIFRQQDGGAEPAATDSPQGARVAVWQTRLSGLDWIDQLCNTGDALSLGGNGYPVWYTAKAAHLLPVILNGPPNANSVWMRDVGDIVTEGWAGRTVIDQTVAAACSPDEWLLIEAWDES